MRIKILSLIMILAMCFAVLFSCQKKDVGSADLTVGEIEKPLAVSAVAEPVTSLSTEKERGRLVYQRCLPCHGDKAQGNFEIKAAPLAQQSTVYLRDQLHKFQKGLRGGDEIMDPTGFLMATQAKSLSEEQIEDVLSYIADFKAEDNTTKRLHGNVDRGKELYDATYCDACHGVKGEGNTAMKAPLLHMLEDWYVNDQLIKFSRGIRGAHMTKDPAGYQMSQWVIGRMVTPREIKDLSSYIQTLPTQDKGLVKK